MAGRDLVEHVLQERLGSSSRLQVRQPQLRAQHCRRRTAWRRRCRPARPSSRRCRTASGGAGCGRAGSSAFGSRRKPTACSATSVPTPGTAARAALWARGPCASRHATNAARGRPVEARDACEQVGGGDVRIDADVARRTPRPSRRGAAQATLVDVVEVRSEGERLRVDRDELRQGVLEAARQREGAAALRRDLGAVLDLELALRLERVRAAVGHDGHVDGRRRRPAASCGQREGRRRDRRRSRRRWPRSRRSSGSRAARRGRPRGPPCPRAGGCPTCVGRPSASIGAPAVPGRHVGTEAEHVARAAHGTEQAVAEVALEGVHGRGVGAAASGPPRISAWKSGFRMRR